MKRTLLAIAVVALLISCATQRQSSSGIHHSPDSSKVQLLMLGSLHFSQFYNKDVPSRNFFSPERQQEIAEVNRLLKAFKPDMIMVEVSPEHQGELDSLYSLFRTDKIELEQLESGSSETYQFGFRLAKKLKHNHIYGVDYDASTSQSLLVSGENHEMFQKGLQNFQKYSRGITADFTNGKTSFKEFLAFLNKPETIELTHYLFFNLPAYVQNGSFRNYEGLNKDEIDTTQIGTEFISLFYKRNLKIYSNILNTQLKHDAKRVLLIMGQAHIGVLKNLIDNNPNFEIVSTHVILKK